MLTNGIAPSIIWKFFRYFILPLIAIILLYSLLNKKYFSKHKRIKLAFYSSLLLTLSVLGQSIWHFDKLYKQSKIAHTYGNFYEEHYVNAEKQKIIFPKEKRNLVMLVIESMESASSDDLNPFSKLTPNLTNITQENITFSDLSRGGGIIQSYGVGWTIAGITAYHCGIPLRLPIGGNSFDNTRSFLGGAVCLGDILHKEGYTQLSLIPHEQQFSGIGSFFKTHKIITKDERAYTKSHQLPKDYKGYWGIKDSLILDLAKQELLALSQKKQTFALYILTIDTHAPNGFFDPNLCRAHFKNTSENNQYKNAILCTDSLVNEFVTWFKKQEFYSNTTLVILGDHLSMKQNFVPNGTKRRIYNTFINPKFFNKIQNAKRQLSHFDLFPTILDSLGVEINGGKLGLGVDLLSNQPTLLEAGDFEKAILQRSKMYENFLYGAQNYP